MPLRITAVVALVAACVAPLATASPASADSGLSVSGTVLLDGRPVGGATVEIVSAGIRASCPEPAGTWPPRTAADGTFTLPTSRRQVGTRSLLQVCTAGSPQVHALVGAGGSGSVEVSEAPEALRPLTADLVAGLVAPVTIGLHSPGRIRISGLDADGRQTSVALLTATDTMRGEYLGCQERAVCTSSSIPSGRYRVRVKPSDESGVWLSDWLDVAPGRTEEVVVPARGTVSGRIRVRGAAKGARYAVAAWPEGQSHDWDIRAKQDGSYRLPALLPGRYVLSVLSADVAGRGVVANETTVVVRGGQHLTHDFALQAGTTLTGRMSGLVRDGLSWGGRVTLLRGGEAVAFGGAGSTTGPTGDLIVPGVPPGTYTLAAVSGTRMLSRRITVSGRAEQRIPGTLTPATPTPVVRGVVHGVRSGSVSFTSLTNGSGFSGTIRHGRYTASGGLPGRYRVEVHADLHLTSSVTAAITRNRRLDLRSGGAFAKVTGRIADGVGPLTTGFIVGDDLTKVGAAPLPPRITPSDYPRLDAGGRFTTYLAPGTYSTGFFTGSRRDLGRDGYSAHNPDGLVPVTPTSFTVRSGVPVDLGTITMRLTQQE